MNRHEIAKLKQKLQAGGVAWKYIKRLIREMQDHREDLTQAALNRGASNEEAVQDALNQMGHYEQVADEMLSRRELKSLGNRYPVTLMVALPVLSYIVLAIATLAGFIGVMSTVFASDQIIEVTQMQVILVESFRVFVMYLLAPMLAMFIITYAIRNSLSLKLAAIGVCILVAFSCSIIIRANYPDPVAGTQGSIGATVGYYLYNSREYMMFFQRLVGTLAILAAAAWAYRSYHLSRAY